LDCRQRQGLTTPALTNPGLISLRPWPTQAWPTQYLTNLRPW